VTLTPQGELTVAEAPRLRSDLLDLIQNSKEPIVVLDLSDVTFIDATAVGVLIGANQRLGREGRSLRIAAPIPTVLRTLRLMGQGTALEIFSTVAEARASGQD
jgi:anti-sigma B factor antagonist